jgi:hypothetical protein
MEDHCERSEAVRRHFSPLRAKRSNPAAFFAVASEAKQSGGIFRRCERSEAISDCFAQRTNEARNDSFFSHSEPQSGEESLRLLRKRKDELAMTT